jgi:hypothetical protein
VTSLENQSLNATLASQDTASAVDAGQTSQSNSVSGSDTASATEGQIVYIISSDGVTAVESQSLAVTVSQTDAVQLQDMWIVDALLSSTDVLSATEFGQAVEGTGLSAEFGAPFTDTSFVHVTGETYLSLNARPWTAQLRKYTEDE